MNSVVLLTLFLVPLIKSVKRLKVNDSVNISERLMNKFLNAMKWNVLLSFITAFSSIMALVSVKNIYKFQSANIT